MSPEVSDSIFRVYSSDPDNQQWGTAFAFDWDGGNRWLSFASPKEATYLLTAKHVVTDVGGVDKVRVGRYPGYPAKLVYSESDGGPDNLIVLRLDDLRDVPHLTVSVSGETDDAVKVFGLRTFSEGFLVRPLKASLGEQVRLESRQHPRHVSGWDLRIEADYDLERGYSGGPVIENESGVVVAVASHREGGRKGVAISTSALDEAWPRVIENMGLKATDLLRRNLAYQGASTWWSDELMLVDTRTLKLLEVSPGVGFSALAYTKYEDDPEDLGPWTVQGGDEFISAVIDADNLTKEQIDQLLRKLFSSNEILGLKPHGRLHPFVDRKFHVSFLFYKGCSPDMLRYLRKRLKQERNEYDPGKFKLTNPWLGLKDMFKPQDASFTVLDFRAGRSYEGDLLNSSSGSLNHLVTEFQSRYSLS